MNKVGRLSQLQKEILISLEILHKIKRKYKNSHYKYREKVEKEFKEIFNQECPRYYSYNFHPDIYKQIRIGTLTKLVATRYYCHIFKKPVLPKISVSVSRGLKTLNSKGLVNLIRGYGDNVTEVQLTPTGSSLLKKIQ